MKKTIFQLCILSLVVVAVFISCSDDDDDAIVSQAIAQGYIIGYVNLYPDFEFYVDIMPMGSSILDIDSVKIDSDKAEYRKDSYWNVYGDGNYQWAEIENDSTNTYTAGDTVEVDFYNNGSSTTVTLKLIDYYTSPAFIFPVQNDTIPLSTSFDAVWSSVPEAEWYGVYEYYYKDSSGTSVTSYKYYSTTDTTLTFSASQNIYDGYYYLYVMAVSGPKADDAVNLNGASLVGKMHSYTTTDYRQIYLGTGDPTPVPGQLDDPINLNENMSEKIMNHFRGRDLRKPNNE